MDTLTAGFVVQTPVYQGPLDLLLDLIEKRKLFINDISLAKVADDFIAHVRNLDQFPIADSAHFVLIASTLVLIKSKSLLPALELTEEEQGSIQDLENRLKLYKRIKHLSVNVKNLFGKEIVFAKSPVRNVDPIFSPSDEITLTALQAAIHGALESLPKTEALPKITVRKVISLEEMIENLTERIKKSIKINFREFASMGKTEKVNVIVSFLAMLELVKQGVIMVKQDQHFSDIEMETESVSVPRYG